MMKRGLKVLLGVFGWVIALPGCGASADDEQEFQFGETEMKGVVVGTWSGTLALEGRPETALSLSIAHRPPEVRPACGSRTLSKPLCINTSTLGLTATLTTADMLYENAELDGTYWVEGRELRAGELNLRGAGIELFATFQGSSFEQGSISGERQGTFTLQR